MYEPFPGNYVWNLSVNICLAMGGVMGEIDPANGRVRAVASANPDDGTEAFFAAWGALADRVRALAYEPRFAIGAVWGGNHDWGGHQKARLRREGDMPVPHYWDHVMWVWGQRDMEGFMALMDRVNLDGHLQHIRVPFLVTHGANDRQIPIRYAQQSFDQAINSPDRELKIFTEREGGIEPCGADNMEPVQNFIGDWLADRFARMAPA